MMSQKLTLEEIKDFWIRQAAEYGQSPSVSWSDYRVIEMEIRELVRRLDDGDKVLDVGCANGFSTIQLASQKAIEIRVLIIAAAELDECVLRNQIAAIETEFKIMPAFEPTHIFGELIRILDLCLRRRGVGTDLKV